MQLAGYAISRQSGSRRASQRVPIHFERTGARFGAVITCDVRRLMVWVAGSHPQHRCHGGRGGITIEALVYFAVWAALIFVMMRFGCGAHVLGHGHHHGDQGTADRTNGDMTPPREATDLVCGLTVEPSTAESSVHDRRVYYYCSHDCREKFEATPLAYVTSGAASPASKEASLIWSKVSGAAGGSVSTRCGVF